MGVVKTPITGELADWGSAYNRLQAPSRQAGCNKSSAVMVQRVQTIENYCKRVTILKSFSLLEHAVLHCSGLWHCSGRPAEHLHSTRLVRPFGATDRRLKSVRASRTTAELPLVEPTLSPAPRSSGGWAAAIPAAASKLSGTRTVSGP